MAKAKANRKPKAEVDQYLPGTEGPIAGTANDGLAKRLPKELREQLPIVDEAIYEAAIAKVAENEAKETTLALMQKHGLMSVTLPRGGSLSRVIGDEKIKYTPPKGASRKTDANGNEDESEE